MAGMEAKVPDLARSTTVGVLIPIQGDITSRERQQRKLDQSTSTQERSGCHPVDGARDSEQCFRIVAVVHEAHPFVRMLFHQSAHRRRFCCQHATPASATGSSTKAPPRAAHIKGHAIHYEPRPTHNTARGHPHQTCLFFVSGRGRAYEGSVCEPPCLLWCPHAWEGSPTKLSERKHAVRNYGSGQVDSGEVRRYIQAGLVPWQAARGM